MLPGYRAITIRENALNHIDETAVRNLQAVRFPKAAISTGKKAKERADLQGTINIVTRFQFVLFYSQSKVHEVNLAKLIKFITAVLAVIFTSFRKFSNQLLNQTISVD